jgi:hypothetical protein
MLFGSHVDRLHRVFIYNDILLLQVGCWFDGNVGRRMVAATNERGSPYSLLADPTLWLVFAYAACCLRTHARAWRRCLLRAFAGAFLTCLLLPPRIYHASAALHRYLYVLRACSNTCLLHLTASSARYCLPPAFYAPYTTGRTVRGWLGLWDDDGTSCY